jgi:thioredoxin 1
MGGEGWDWFTSFAMTDGRRTMEILKVDEANFTLEVLEAALPVLVDFTAAWCGPCKMLDPVVKQLAQEWDGRVKVVKLDIDENQDLTVQYQVMGVPTLMLFVKGKPVQRVSGYMSKDKLVAKFKPHL